MKSGNRDGLRKELLRIMNHTFTNKNKDKRLLYMYVSVTKGFEIFSKPKHV